MGARIRSALRGLVSRNVELKFLALLIAFALFYSREREEMADRTLQVAVMTTGEDAMTDLIRVSPLPPNVGVTLRGPAKLLASLRSDQVGPIMIRIRDAVALETVPIDRGALRLPDGIRMLGADPAAIRFRFERRTEATVPVLADVGPAAPDVAADSAATGVDPPVAVVSGARSSVDRVTVLHTEAIDISGWSIGPNERIVSLELPDLPWVTVSPHTVRIRVLLAPDRVVSQRRGVPVEIVRGGDLDERGTLIYGAESRRVDVRIEGLRSAVDALPNSDIRLFARVDRSAFREADGTGAMEAAIPIEAESVTDRWTILAIEPPTLRATYIPPVAPSPPDTGDAGDAGLEGTAGD